MAIFNLYVIRKLFIFNYTDALVRYLQFTGIERDANSQWKKNMYVYIYIYTEFVFSRA